MMCDGHMNRSSECVKWSKEYEQRTGAERHQPLRSQETFQKEEDIGVGS